MSVTISQYAERYYSEANLILLMVEILHHRECRNLVNNGINYLSTGAGFQPSTVFSLFGQGPDNWQVLWKRPHPWPSQDLISWHLGRSGNDHVCGKDLSWQKMYQNMLWHDGTNMNKHNKPNIFIYIYILYSYLLVETHIQAVLDSFRWDCVPFIASHSSGLAKFCTDCPYWWPAFVSISFCVMLGTALEGCFQMPLLFIDVSLRYSSNIWWDSFLNPNIFPKKSPHKFCSTKIDHLGPTII